ncbi:MAG: hypothetical protein CMK49_02805 [Prochlorococcus sp. SP3034]|nr:hypothetical protein [Prochlorococcus sp. SP3034]|tara:strand:+ start:6831 stop:7349 length:519 start_codon:yes stop_codon:yes gene_type:complete
MKLFKIIPISLLVAGTVSVNPLLLAENKNSESYKVLSSNNNNLSIKNVQSFLSEGDRLIKLGKFEKAKESYDKGRNLAKKLASFYRDLNGAFRGLDARIPREMDQKGRDSLSSWAEANARLAALYKRKNEPEVAVPLLIEIITLMSPASSQGKAAYGDLKEMGFVETSFQGF